MAWIHSIQLNCTSHAKCIWNTFFLNYRYIYPLYWLFIIWPLTLVYHITWQVTCASKPSPVNPRVPSVQSLFIVLLCVYLGCADMDSPRLHKVACQPYLLYICTLFCVPCFHELGCMAIFMLTWNLFSLWDAL